jgi:microcystin-dependent protein
MRLSFVSSISLVVLLLALSSPQVRAQDEPFVGEVRMFAGNFAPVGWMLCEGQVLAIADYDVLFNLIGTTYGGDGVSTFALPDLRSRVPLGDGAGSGLSTYTIGQTGGVETVTLTANQLPVHTHPFNADLLAGSTANPAGRLYAKYPGSVPVYATGGQFQMNAGVVSPAGGSQPHDNLQPYVAINYIISLFGIYPSQSENPPAGQVKGGQTAAGTLSGVPFLGQILLVAFSFPPKNWANCSGQMLPIAQNQALFALLGTTYGGNGVTTFALPDLQGRVPLHADGSTIYLGTKSGEETHTLTASEMPAHTHAVNASSSVGTAVSPLNAFPAKNGEASHLYGNNAGTALSPSAVGTIGAGQPHENRKPYLAMHYIIALTGVFPSQNAAAK